MSEMEGYGACEESQVNMRGGGMGKYGHRGANEGNMRVLVE